MKDAYHYNFKLLFTTLNTILLCGEGRGAGGKVTETDHILCQKLTRGSSGQGDRRMVKKDEK